MGSIVRGRRVALSTRHERWIHVALIFVYVTGIAWMSLHYGVNRGSALEDGWRIAETWTLRAHGAAAMAALIAFGSVLAIHIPSAWKLERNLLSGISMLAAVVLLAVTGWLLYYAPGESARAWSSYVHMAVGFAGPLVLLWHLAYRKRLACDLRRMEIRL
jgi:hypothetical protein